MLLKIEIPSRALIVPAVNAGPLLATLEHAFSVSEEGWGKDRKYVKSDEKIAVSFIGEDELKEAPEPMKKALANYEQAQSNWLAEYTKRTAAEKERDELKAKLATINATAAVPAPAPSSTVPF